MLLVKSRFLFIWADRELGRLCSAIGHAAKRFNQSGSSLAIACKHACTNARTHAREAVSSTRALYCVTNQSTMVKFWDLSTYLYPNKARDATVCFAGTVQFQVNSTVTFTYIEQANELRYKRSALMCYVEKLNVKFNVLTAVLVTGSVDASSVNCLILRSTNK